MLRAAIGVRLLNGRMCILTPFLLELTPRIRRQIECLAASRCEYSGARGETQWEELRKELRNAE